MRETGLGVGSGLNWPDLLGKDQDLTTMTQKNPC